MRKLVWCIIGLIIVSIVCGILFITEQSLKPFDVRVAEAGAEWMRELYRDNPSVALALARQNGETIEEAMKDPYDDWAPKVSLGLISFYAFSWIVYSTFLFFKFVDKQGHNQSPTR